MIATQTAVGRRLITDNPQRGNTGKWWTPLGYHRTQQAYARSEARFNVVPAGRRSGKTKIAKRRSLMKAFQYTGREPGRVIFGAPTHLQAKDIFWADLKAAVPKRLRGRVSESELTIPLLNGVLLKVIGLDKPERVEGDPPVIGGVVDEYGNMKESVWGEHLRPALTDTGGWMDFIGVPEGRNHYFDLFGAVDGKDDEWQRHHWITAEVLPLYLGEAAAAKEIEAARRDLDPLTYRQEYEADFVTFEGRAYYTWDSEKFVVEGLRARVYDARKPLILDFDFNIKPGTASVVQEVADLKHDGLPAISGGTRSCVIGEVHIAQNSNTPLVCDRLVTEWGRHEGEVFCYGDATGGAGGSAKVQGSDWDLVEVALEKVFGNRLTMMNERSNPRERSRLNAMNSRVHQGRLLADKEHAPNFVRDMEGTPLKKDGSGSIDKAADYRLSHASDGVGYYVYEEFPIDETVVVTSREI